MGRIKITLNRLLIILFFSCELIDPILSVLAGSSVSNYICDGLIVLTLLYKMLKEPRSIKWYSVLLFVLSIGAFVASLYLHPEYYSVMFVEYNIWKRIFAVRKGLFFMIILSLEDDPNDLIKTLKISAIPVWLIYTIRVITGTGLSEATGSNHAYGFVFLFVSLLYAICYLKNKNKIDLIISIISLVEILLVASRMTMVAYVAFWALYLFAYETGIENRGKKIIGLIGGLVIALLITSNWFLQIIESVMARFGISSKILNSIVTGNNVMDGGRKYMFANNLILIQENPWGLGVYWDRYIYNRFHYTHNFLYEIIIDFGWLIGALLILSLLINTIKILRSDDKEWKLLFILFFSLSMIRLVLSYSFWIDNNFWGMIAIIISYKYFCKRRKRENANIIYG